MAVNSHKQLRIHAIGDVFNALEMHALIAASNGAARLVRLVISTFAHADANAKGVFKQLASFSICIGWC